MGLVFEKETYGILGAMFEVYKDKGAGFLEAVYQECLEIEFELRGMSFMAKSELELAYKGRVLRQLIGGKFSASGVPNVEYPDVAAGDGEKRPVDAMTATVE